MTLSGKKTLGKKIVSKVITLDCPNVANKTFEIVSATRAVLPKGKKSAFNVHLRVLDKNNKVVLSSGLSYNASCPWKYRSAQIKVPATGKVLQLVFEGINFDSNSIGETRNTFIFER